MGGASSLTGLGEVYSALGRTEDALSSFAEASRIFEQIGSASTPEAAVLMFQTGRSKVAQGDLVAALADFEDARRIREATLTLQAPDGIDLLQAIGAVQRRL